jgi:hypothetical protein
MAIGIATQAAEVDSASWHSDNAQPDRILTILGMTDKHLFRVHEETLSRYYQYLAANLSFPFVAHYPVPTTPQEDIDFRCVVLELLDPARHLRDEFDGIFCKTRKGKYEINLPLTELVVHAGNPDSQLIEDYVFWFWNWR